MTKQQSGFTLIELVLVIVILGILAATALPRFTNLTTDARNAALNGMGASAKSGAAIAHSIQLARNLASNATGVTIEAGAPPVDFSSGYPTVGTINNTVIADSTFSFAGGVWTLGTLTNCSVTYNASVAGAFPVVSVTSSGC